MMAELRLWRRERAEHDDSALSGGQYHPGPGVLRIGHISVIPRTFRLMDRLAAEAPPTHRSHLWLGAAPHRVVGDRLPYVRPNQVLFGFYRVSLLT
ncbi:MAG: hypothetical protein QM784_32410, partial [Polyangiaceae bacterium]